MQLLCTSPAIISACSLFSNISRNAFQKTTSLYERKNKFTYFYLIYMVDKSLEQLKLKNRFLQEALSSICVWKILVDKSYHSYYDYSDASLTTFYWKVERNLSSFRKRFPNFLYTLLLWMKDLRTNQRVEALRFSSFKNIPWSKISWLWLFGIG